MPLSNAQLAAGQQEERIPGRWYPSAKTNHHYEAVCGVCNKVVPAVNLKLHRRPFGRGEVWACCK